MNILINASNLKAGGGLQVADSICRLLDEFQQHTFFVVLSSFFYNTKESILGFSNVTVVEYNIKNNFNTLVLGRDSFLDNLVVLNRVDVVLTIFGPSRWNPRCMHLCGFARSHLVMPESPYFQRMSKVELLKACVRNFVLKTYFKRSSNYFYSENPHISQRLEKMFKGSKVFTVTNSYNQIFDYPEKWKYRKLPEFKGTTILTIATSYPHKNLEISIDIVKWLTCNYPDFAFRFVFTIDEKKFPKLNNDIRKHILFLGTVDILECPSLYEQCDIAFQPSLLECFTATYPEAMRMGKPNITVDLPYAKGLCGDAALYYAALSPEDAAKKIYELANNGELREQLVIAGNKRLEIYDNYKLRIQKLMMICEQIVRENKKI